jgi:hypothetical protein
MFFRERTSDWVNPQMHAGMAAALIITVAGVLYFGLFSNGVIERFSHSPSASVVAADR